MGLCLLLQAFARRPSSAPFEPVLHDPADRICYRPTARASDHELLDEAVEPSTKLTNLSPWRNPGPGICTALVESPIAGVVAEGMRAFLRAGRPHPHWINADDAIGAGLSSAGTAPH